jgi:AraC-like DNA-binding protein
MTSPLPPVVLLDALLRGLLLALLALLAWAFWRERPASPAVRAGVALTVGLAVQTAGTLPWFEQVAPRLLQAPIVALSVGNAALFWIFVQALFDDAFAFRPVHALAWGAAAALGGLNCAVLAHSGAAIAPFTTGLQRALPLLFAVLTVQAAAAGWRVDLVEGRRRLRGFIVVAGVAYTLLELATRLASGGGRLSEAGAVLETAMLLCVVAPLAFSMLRMTHSELFPALPAPRQTAAPRPVRADLVPLVADAEPPASPAQPEQALADALLQLMADGRAYRQENLSIASLASQLAVPEYRLRRVINQHLGHRNFNAFVNGFRLEEARSALGDPACRALPVLTIALEAGFQSIGPFNRAFKAATGSTPTEYRREKLANLLADS